VKEEAEEKVAEKDVEQELSLSLLEEQSKHADFEAQLAEFVRDSSTISGLTPRVTEWSAAANPVRPVTSTSQPSLDVRRAGDKERQARCINFSPSTPGSAR
jgi:hypothetical protein